MKEGKKEKERERKEKERKHALSQNDKMSYEEKISSSKYRITIPYVPVCQGQSGLEFLFQLPL